jgi:hypothetical protein
MRAPSAPDAACCEHRNVDGGQDLVQQRQHAVLAPDVATGADTLGDDDIGPRLRRGNGFLPGSDLPTDECSLGVDSLDQAGIRPPPEEIDQPRSACSVREANGVGILHLLWREDEVDAERAGGQRLRLINEALQVGKPAAAPASSPDHSQCPGV